MGIAIWIVGIIAAFFGALTLLGFYQSSQDHGGADGAIGDGIALMILIALTIFFAVVELVLVLVKVTEK